MHHIAAYYESIAQNAENDLAPVTDGQLSIFNNHFVAQKNTSLIGMGAASVNIQYARLITPTIRAMTSEFIRPVNQALNFGMPQRYHDLYDNPLTIKATEEIQINGIQTGAAAEVMCAFIVLDVVRTPRPAGQIITMRGTSTTAAVAGAWTTIAMTWHDVLPPGNYAVVGMTHRSANGLCARLIMDQLFWRPGAPSITAFGNDVHPRFRLGGLGVWGNFNAWAMPSVEVLAGAADAAHEVYLDIVMLNTAPSA